MHRYVDAPPELKGIGGTVAEPLLDLVVGPGEVFLADDPGPNRKRYVRCEGAAYGCPAKWVAPRASGRVINHASQCQKLDNIGDGTLRDQCLAKMIGKSLGERVEKNPEQKAPEPSAKTPSEESDNPPPSKRPRDATSVEPQSSSTPSTSVQPVTKPLKQATVVEYGRKARIQALKDQLDFDAMIFVCVSGMAPSKVDLPEWKTMWKHGNAEYAPASAAVLTEVHIPNEAARISLLQLSFLQTQDNLTVTFDGNSTKRQDSAYTFHVWTPDRRVFLFETDESSLESHTGVKIAKVLKGVSQVIYSSSHRALFSHGANRRLLDELDRSVFVRFALITLGILLWPERKCKRSGHGSSFYQIHAIVWTSYTKISTKSRTSSRSVLILALMLIAIN